MPNPKTDPGPLRRGADQGWGAVTPDALSNLSTDQERHYKIVHEHFLFSI
jgi:hypothetical protein